MADQTDLLMEMVRLVHDDVRALREVMTSGLDGLSKRIDALETAHEQSAAERRTITMAARVGWALLVAAGTGIAWLTGHAPHWLARIKGG